MFFNGASKGNPGVAGGGGVLLDFDNIMEFSFSYGLGVGTNNIVESLVLWKGLNQSLTHGISKSMSLRTQG